MKMYSSTTMYGRVGLCARVSGCLSPYENTTQPESPAGSCRPSAVPGVTFQLLTRDGHLRNPGGVGTWAQEAVISQHVGLCFNVITSSVTTQSPTILRFFLDRGVEGAEEDRRDRW